MAGLAEDELMELYEIKMLLETVEMGLMRFRREQSYYRDVPFGGWLKRTGEADDRISAILESHGFFSEEEEPDF